MGGAARPAVLRFDGLRGRVGGTSRFAAAGERVSLVNKPRHSADVVTDDDNGTFGPLSRRRDEIFVSSDKARLRPASRIRGELFEQMLAERGLSMTEFQKQSGIARSTLERARRGEPLATTTLLRISDTLDRIPVRTTILRLLGREAT
jgi:DNA-binding Xre family transcriptional regulator